MKFGGTFDFEDKQDRLAELNLELSQPEIWNTPKVAAELNKEKSQLEEVVLKIESLASNIRDYQELAEQAKQESDFSLVTELTELLEPLLAELKQLELRRMFKHDLDAGDAYLEIQAGSGGTEAQDWAEMLLRMYLRWAERRNFKSTVLDLSFGEVAGIKGATIKLEGAWAYGWARTETGIHRLVRKSPFDSSNKRHTSFAAVFVSPLVDDDISIQINPAELRIDTYRASGAGGQHVNRTDSAVRITHIPSGIVVQCQSDRSQHKNKAQAMSQLHAKLYELEQKKLHAEKDALEANKDDIGWGSQIRSYVLDDSRVKDLRTNVETSNTKDVLDGNLDQFIEASLKSGV